MELYLNSSNTWRETFRHFPFSEERHIEFGKKTEIELTRDGIPTKLPNIRTKKKGNEVGRMRFVGRSKLKTIFWVLKKKKKKKCRIADSRNWWSRSGSKRRPLETEKFVDSLGGPVGSNLKVGPPTNKFGAFIRKWWPPTERKMAEMHEPHKWKTNKNGLKRCLRSTPFVYLIKSIFWSSQRVSCHRIPIFPLYFFIHLLFFFKFQNSRATWPEARAACLLRSKKAAN